MGIKKMEFVGSEEFEQALMIDQHDLDTELLSQADLFYRVAQKYTEAAAIKDEMHEAVKVADAKRNLLIREEFESLGKKITEAQVNATVLTHSDHSEAFAAWLDAKEESDMLGHLKEAFLQRSYMLKDLAQLYIAGYFSEKSVSADDVTTKEAVYQKRKNRMHERRQNNA